MRGETVEHAELCLRHGVSQVAGGVWVDIVATPLRGVDGSHMGGVVVMRDNTERRQATEEIARLNHNLQANVVALRAVNKELEAFSYSVSHDLRAPLRSINGFSQALLEDYGEKLDATGSSYLQRVRAATQRMGQLIDDMLALSQVTRTEMNHANVDLSELACVVGNEVQLAIRNQTVEFTVQAGLTACCDGRLLKVVLENLLGNAWKFTAKRATANVEFGATQIDGETVYFVRDDGAGFDTRYADKLFGAFQRLHAMNEFAGTGIGLATVARIIHRHNGRVWAEGAVESGATFYFTL